MTREAAKDLFRKNKDAYGKPEGIMGKIDLIYDDFDIIEKEIGRLYIAVEDHKKVIMAMRNTLRFCARNDVGTFYQQESAREMANNNTHITWDRYNPDGSTVENYRKWIFQRAEDREKGSGENVLKELDEYEKTLQIK